MKEFDQQLEGLLKQASLQYIIYQHNGDTERMEKTSLFARKLQQKEYVIGFAGHFSAGKSSMINALSGEDLLASSPIPTSANIVKVHKSDEDYAIVYMHNEKPVKFEAGYDFKTVKELSKNGDLVSQIEIGHSTSTLPSGVTVMDTPGVDSTDDAHRMSTESALHIADIVFYTMDYNHVQSELNFQFTKQLMKYNPNVYLIVNMIDKHKENELSFEEFKATVHHSFSAWGVEPKGVFFTSLREPEHPNNDFEAVKKIVMDSMNDWQDQLVQTATNTLRLLQSEHDNYLIEERQDRLDLDEDILSADDWANHQDILEQYNKLNRQVELFSIEAWNETFEEERKELLANAAIMPADLRDKLRLYLESKQEGFKVGGLFSAKKKTEEERNRRKEEAFSSYQTVVHAQITGHLKGLMKKALKDVGALSEERAEAIDGYVFDLPFSLIEQQVQIGALLTGDAVLNFANRVAEATKRYYIQETDKWKDTQATTLEAVATETAAPAKLKMAGMQDKVDAINAVLEIEGYQQYSAGVMHQASNEIRKEANNQLTFWEKAFAQALAEIRLFDESMLKPKEVALQEEEIQQVVSATSLPIDGVIKRALHTANAVKEVQGFAEVASYLENKVERLQKKDFTIALFGAFSAGKSSFSNALMGAKVLPVSPNPTTAAINKIRPVTAEHPHETADVQLKTAAQMLEDIQSSYAAIGLSVASLDEALNRADEGLAVQLSDERLNVHKSFIRAYKEGYPTFKTELGKVLRVEREEFEKFVAQENKSCFVDNIDFYYDSPLTRMGVTLVDTPGADSINARHTGVAFEYIRNADAILFITYYNHAFAKADREFLIQLGRVKDAFELDKMFFIVNAIDLATTEEEQEDVKGYVRSELQRFGIRFPRLYGVSSLMALKEKVEGADFASGMPPFEENFHTFLNDELSALAVQALAEEVDKTEQRLGDLIAQTEDNLKRKDERLAELTTLEQHIKTKFSALNTSMMESETKQELDELLYYVLQRVYYRYPEFFKEGYNPSTFAAMPAQQALEHALKEVLQSLRFDFTQEMRVTNFRLSQFISKKLQVRFKDEVRELKELNRSFSFLGFESSEPDLLNFEGPFAEMAKYTGVKSHFRNQKAFFEKNEKMKLSEALETLTKPDAQNYLDGQKVSLMTWAITYIGEEAERLRLHIYHQALEQIATERLVLQEESRLASWKSIYAQLQYA
ncbi:dynamin family protein [Lysinibacillus parviboronicapiens]|uniref:dynamin family protein n=1 Tax=Lysinibacillus parviboronicapiens TaxID=436516 RepID=UPI000D36EDAB|nr:dynamin family protein [Lysinibacillus parviboronicapiens]